MNEDRKYWRPEAEKLLSDLGRIRDAEMKKLMIRPVVIQATEQERQQMEERFKDQIIQPVDFANVTSATVPDVTIEDLIRSIEEWKRQEELDKAAQAFLEELKLLAYGTLVKPLPMQIDTNDLWEKFRFKHMGERVTAEALAVYEPKIKTE